MKMPNRLYCLDVARGLAAFSVVLWHWQHFFYASPSTQSPEFSRESQPLYDILSPFYNYGGNAVFFFFMLSGFVFFWLYGQTGSKRSYSFKSFALARFSRLYPLHFLTLLLVFLLQYIYMEAHQEYFVYPCNDAFHFGLHSIFGSHWGFEQGHSFNAPIWSVSIEIGLYAVFFVAVATGRSSSRYLATYIVILYLLPKFGYTIGRWRSPLETFFTGGLVLYGLQFYLKHKWRNHLTDLTLIAFPIAGWTLMSLSEAFSTIVLNRYFLLSRLIFPTTIVGLVLLELIVKVPFYKLKWIGNCTYSSYLLHFPLQLLFAILASQFFLDPKKIFYSTSILVLFTLILTILSLITFNFFEVPMQNFIRKLGRGLVKGEQK